MAPDRRRYFVKNPFGKRLRWRGILTLCLAATTILAQSNDKDQDLPSRKVSFAIPFEFDYDFGAANGNAFIGRFLPLVSIPLGKQWRLNNLTLALVAAVPAGGRAGFPGNPDPIGSTRSVVGLADWINATLFVPPVRSKKLTLGFGLGFGIPLATDTRIGSEKWTAGPAFRIGYRPGKWNLNALIVNLWSYAGNPERGEVNQLIIRGLIRRPLSGTWFLTSNPIITNNWGASAGQRWLVPLGGGIGRIFSLGNRSLSIAAHFYYNITKPDGAPDGLFRLDFLFPVPGSQQNRQN